MNRFKFQTLIYAAIIYSIGIVVFLIFFNDLVLFFLVPGLITLINLFILVRIIDYDKLSHTNVLLTLFVRLIIYGLSAFLLIWFNKDSQIIIEIGIAMVIGYSIAVPANIIYALFNANKNN